MGKATPNRNQHWVPQFYLRSFATAETRGTKIPKIWSFPLQEGSEFKTNCRNVAAQRDLYSLCEPEVDSRLSELENGLGRYWPSIAEENHAIDRGFKKAVSLFIATLYMRHPRRRDSLRSFRERLATFLDGIEHDDRGRPLVTSVQTKEGVFDVEPGAIEQMADLSEQAVGESWGRSILDHSGEVATDLMSKSWTVLVCEQPVFITSDHPVVLSHPDREDAPISNAKTQVIFPLSPNRLLLINHPPHRDGQLVGISAGKEDAFNYQIFCAADRHVFSPWDSIYVCKQVADFHDEMRHKQFEIALAAFPEETRNVGRNDPCPCGSKQKYKRCCGFDSG